ncbi:YD repeat-containing protein [Paraburkholderia sediminicola]
MINLSRLCRSGSGAWKRSRRAPVGRVVSCCAVVWLSTLAVSACADEISYGYDALGRLTSVTVAGATAYYDYDAAGNITAIRRQGGLSAEVPASGADSSPASEAGALSAPPASTQASMR